MQKNNHGKVPMQNILIYKPIGADEKKHFLAEHFVSAFDVFESGGKGEAVQMRFNSPGGSVFDGFAMISKMDASPLKTNGLVDGLAASMAAFIALSCDKLTMNANAKLMLHLPQVGITGDAAKLRATADELDTHKTRFAEIIANKAGITTEKAEALYLQAGTDVWLTAPEALAAGLCDEITGVKNNRIPAKADAGELHAIYAQIIDTTNKNKMDKQKMVGLLGAQANAEMTDDEIYAMVENVVSDNVAKAEKITELQATVEGYETEKAEARSAEVLAMLDEAIEGKKITAKQKEAWAAMFDKDFENAKTMLTGLAAVPNLSNLPAPGDNDSTKAEMVAAWNEADKAGTLEDLKAAKPEEFKKMFKAKFNKDYAE